MPSRSEKAFPSRQSGIAIMVLAMALVPVGDSLSKILSASMHPFEVALWRYIGQGLILTVVLLVMRQSFRPGNLLLLAFAGLTSAGTLVALVGAFAIMPIATAIAIFFVEPLLLTVISAIFLREPTGWRRFAAVGVGLVGAVVVIRPNFATFGPTALLPLVAALSFAVHAATIRHISAKMGALALQFWITVFAIAFLALGLWALVTFTGVPFSAPTLPGHTWLLVATAAPLSALTFVLITEAFKRTPASTLAPFQYLEIVGATAVGYIIFGDFPDMLTWVGTAIILASGLYVFRRERKAGQSPTEPLEVRD